VPLAASSLAASLRARVRRQRGTIRDWRAEWRSRWRRKQPELVSRLRKLCDHTSSLLRSPRRRAAAAAALVAVLALDAYLLHARFRGASNGASGWTRHAAAVPGAAVTSSGAAREPRPAGQPSLRELAAARDRSQTGTSSPDDPSAQDYAWPVPTRPATRDRDAALEPWPSGPDEVRPSPAPAPVADSMRPRRAGALNGSWEIQDVVSSTSDPAFRELRLTYRIVLRQDGERVSGDGEKWAENGRRIPAVQRTPIHLSGEVMGREVRVRFTESGSRRDSAGTFRWRLSVDGTSGAGTFASSAAGARGVSAAVRLP
jgi:hypothetical protein